MSTAAGRTAPRKDQLLLRQHHGHSMGGGGKPTWRPQRPRANGGTRDWQYWPGSWSPSMKQHSWGTWEQDSAEFPKYDATKVDLSRPDTQIIAVQTDSSARGSDHAGELQSLLNQSRKLVNKVARLEELRRQRRAQWEQYERKVQQAYRTEKERYRKTISKIEEDLDQARLLDEEVQDQMKKAIEVTGRGQGKVQSSHTDLDWERMIEEEDAPMSPEEEQYLLKRLERRNPGFATALRTATEQPPGLRPEEHPTRSTRSLTKEGTIPQGYTAVSPGAGRMRSEPYPPQSPNITAPDVETKPKNAEKKPIVLHPGQRDPSRARVPGDVEQPRPDIKAATMATKKKPETGNQVLQQKLDAKRGVGTALTPFGRPPTGEAPPPNEAEATNVQQEANFVEDDPDLDTLNMSPGFKEME